MSIDLDPHTDTLDVVDPTPPLVPTVVEASMPVRTELRARRPNVVVAVATVVGALAIGALYIGVPLALGLQAQVEHVAAAGGIAAVVLVLVALLVLTILRRTARDRHVDSSPVPAERAAARSSR